MTTDALVAQGAPLQKLHQDEKVEWIWESDAEKPMFGRYRYQHIQLVRDGNMRHFVAELGPTGAHPLWAPFNFWAAGLYSVGEVLAIAERLRENRPPEEHEPIDLARSYLNLQEENQKRRSHRSTFGAYHVQVR